MVVVSRKRWNGTIFECHATDEYKFDAADPNFIDNIVKKCQEAMV